MALFDTIRAGASGASDGYQIEKSLMLNDQDQTDFRELHLLMVIGEQ